MIGCSDVSEVRSLMPSSRRRLLSTATEHALQCRRSFGAIVGVTISVSYRCNDHCYRASQLCYTATVYSFCERKLNCEWIALMPGAKKDSLQCLAERIPASWFPGTQEPVSLRLRYPIACISGFAVVAYLPRLA